MKRKRLTILIWCLVLVDFSCTQQSKEYKTKAADPEFLHRSVKQLSDVIVYDIFSPPVASRVYAYPSIAAFEVMINEYPQYRSLAGQLHGLSEVPPPDPNQEYCFPLAGVHAFLKCGKQLIFSEEKIEVFQKKIYQEFKELGVPSAVFDRSIAYGNKVSDHIMAWADKDNYKQTRTFPKYTVTDEKFRWQPTPPAYIEAIEPHWNKIRTFVIDSAQQFIPAPPTLTSLEKGSDFYNEIIEVYETGKNLTDEQAEIASFWDCNPYVMHTKGHLMFATKKITPGGHWMGITTVACRTSTADMIISAEAYALVTIALVDGFISSWDEKFRSNLIRPETLINKYIDEDWVPLLQTPPFPEYPSAHSVISRAAAIALTDLFGEHFYFEDTVELEYGLPVRTFDSFIEASDEAAISRLYGGIHYMPACQLGVNQGKKLGTYLIEKISTKKKKISARIN